MFDQRIFLPPATVPSPGSPKVLSSAAATAAAVVVANLQLSSSQIAYATAGEAWKWMGHVIMPSNSLKRSRGFGGRSWKPLTKKMRMFFLDRVSRATRGKRMTKLLDEEIEEDELFWNQDALKEEEEDFNYEEEPEVADEFDSDFDEDEPEPDEEGENDADERVQKKKRLIFPGKPSTKKKKKQKVLSKLDSDPKDLKLTQESTPPENHDVPDDTEGERTIRKSTRTAVIVRQAERDAIRAALQATMKPIKRKKEGEEKRMTQEEMLLEAAQTEIINLRNLERVLAREEEVKKEQLCIKLSTVARRFDFYQKMVVHIWNSVKECPFSQRSQLHPFLVSNHIYDDIMIMSYFLGTNAGVASSENILPYQSSPAGF
ncbi:hypothetical protein LWI29_019937 [Acer saccharum]|uniref:Vps72/YL1 N-terminal domain-containing protein n=1 Tax=Acer saccharum TaxID=4024 RepID=A0AA39VTS7_ACESA|nr:hypothetical protein LWI29_019937 [Acer saccharum]